MGDGKASCSVCGSYLTSIGRTGYCPNACLGGVHRFVPGAFGEFCGAMIHTRKGRRLDDYVECGSRAEYKIHTLALVNAVALHGADILEAV